MEWYSGPDFSVKEYHNQVKHEKLDKALSNKWRCLTCGVLRQARYLYYVHHKRVPHSLSGYYCMQHAYEILKEYKRTCASCGDNFRERCAGSNNSLCPDCRIGDLAYESHRLTRNLSRAVEAGLPATLTLPEWLDTLDHFDWKCAYCGGDYNVLEHFTPISQGGGTTADNCVPGCFRCNSANSARTFPSIPQPDYSRVKEYLNTK